MTIHDMATLDHPEWFSPRFAAWYRFLIPRLARRVAHIIVVSESTKLRLLTHCRVDPDKVTVIHPGVDKRFNRCPADAVNAMRAALTIPDGVPYVLAVGSLEPRKNLGRLLLAWRKLLPSLRHAATLVLAGGKGKRSIFAGVPEFNELPDRVCLTGYVPEELLPALYSGASVFVFPSMYEGFGSPPLEAMACGTPVIAGNRTSLPEVIGDAGILVDPLDVDAIASAIANLLNNPANRERLASAALQRAAGFSWDSATEQTWKVLLAASDC